MKVLVTGGRGLLGTAIVQNLLARGHECVVVQRNPSGLAGVTEILDDLTSPERSEEWIAGVEAVVHLAARVGIVGSFEEFHLANVKATENLLSLSKAAGVRAFIYASSPSVAHTGAPLMGVGAEPAIPAKVRGFYSQTKAMAELIVLAENAPGFATLALRPHLVWGPGDTQLVGRIIERAKSGRLVLIDGGHSLIDATYVDNAATAFGAAVGRADSAAGQALMVTNGQPRTVKELLTRMCEAAQVSPPTRSIPFQVAFAGGLAIERAWRNKSSEPPLTSFLVEQLGTAHWFNIEKTKSLLDWEPVISLDEGFETLRRSFVT